MVIKGDDKFLSKIGAMFYERATAKAYSLPEERQVGIL